MREIHPSNLKGSVSPPPSKSISHRALILGALARPGTKVFNLLESDDVLATKSALQLMGAEFKSQIGSTIIMKSISHGSKEIDCKNSGTTLRLLSALASKYPEQSILTGDESLQTRPISELMDVLQKMGAKVSHNRGHPPVRIQGNEYPKRVELSITGQISSQFISSLLILGAARGNSTTTLVQIKPPILSKPYIDLTVRMLEDAGVKIGINKFQYVIQGKDFLEPFILNIPSDYSSIAVFVVAGALPGNEIVIHTNDNSLPQADSRVLLFMRKMGARISTEDRVIKVKHTQLNGIDADLSDCPDLFPMMCVAGSLAKGETRLYGAAHLRFKESNRIQTTCEMLNKFGIDVTPTGDGAIINGSKPKGGSTVNTYGDHRVAIAASILSTQADKPSKIINSDCVSISYPLFFDHLHSLQQYNSSDHKKLR
ncbi:MAG: 3-phosphoshikimate 1-carboxyvinyltransferase [Candidatus Kariarchaeaceae archaeon]|jgi:3-phosphoshikimate 1-carboxyvinyltransferase